MVAKTPEDKDKARIQRRASNCDTESVSEIGSGSGSNSGLGLSYGSGNGTGGGQKRTVLNVLERARREGLKSNFHRLRDSVPLLAGNKRVPKGQILRKAADYIRQLHNESQELENGLEALRRENQRLLQCRNSLYNVV